ncbi:MAG: MOSC domain-containing protein [Gemmatimonadaceae bacterium]|nr:MOSC domain-containing protein [Gemmatimonadaceae bacterium]NUO94736.1 MOSC domain-containing protein [Gemmatimonadaceae bacterium]NUS33148.1 MOSC domain-containing protein [Gemmatimonadaceae bacterium]
MTRRDGRVTGLQRSAGGVPKLPVERAMVGAGGMEGDRQANRRFHGGPDRALCLYAQERLDALAAAGHPVERGTLGENVTIAGLPWEEVRPGARLRLGGVEVEVTGYAAPCSKISFGFADGGSSRVGQRSNPGWSRVYVRILSAGELTVGDPVTLHGIKQ